MFSNHQQCKKNKAFLQNNSWKLCLPVPKFHHLQEEFSSWEVSKIALPFFLGKLRQQYRLYHHKNVDKTAPFIYQQKIGDGEKFLFSYLLAKLLHRRQMFLRNFIFRQIIAKKFFLVAFAIGEIWCPIWN